MRVVVTGAAGKLGRVTVAHLRGEGYEVVATDRVCPPDPPRGFVAVDLLSEDDLADLFEGATATVHLAALSHRAAAPASGIFAQNLQTLARVLEASIASGVSKFVYASSTQVISSEPRAENEPTEVAYLRFDDESPPNPTGAYGFSKLGSEILLKAVFQRDGREAVALRFPWLAAAHASQAWGRRLMPTDEKERRVVVEQGFSCLSLNDAARLIDATLRACLPGFRTYLPAVSVVPREYIPEHIARYYPGVSCRVPVDEMTSLVDLSRVKEETGWMPLDVPIHPPPPTARSPFARLVRRLTGAR